MEPGILYKYRSLANLEGDRVRDTFENSAVYFPSPNEFNDPFDCKIELLLNGDEERWKNFIGKRLKTDRPNLSPADRLVEIHRIIRSGSYKNLDPSISTRAAKRAGVYCLSAVNDDILMWSHYANAHRGICIGFRAGPNDAFFCRSQEVVYCPTYPLTSIFDSDERRFETAVLTKSEHWNYEKEYRVIEPQGPGKYTFPQDLLVEVILGCEASESDRKSVTEWAQARSFKPKIFVARKKEREFGLKIEEAL